MSCYYAIIGVRPDADARAIKRAYRRNALRYHPDKNPNDPEAASSFLRVNEAFQVLSNASSRREYDVSRGFIAPPVPQSGIFLNRRHSSRSSASRAVNEFFESSPFSRTGGAPSRFDSFFSTPFFSSSFSEMPQFPKTEHEPRSDKRVVGRRTTSRTIVRNGVRTTKTRTVLTYEDGTQDVFEDDPSGRQRP